MLLLLGKKIARRLSQATALFEKMENTRYILIVDDEEAIVQTILRRILIDPAVPLEPLVASDGYEAMALMREHPVAVILLDIQMRNMNGIEVVQAVMADEQLRDIPIIISSGYIGDEVKEELSALGVKYFLDKPYPFDQMIAKVQEAAGLSSQKG